MGLLEAIVLGIVQGLTEFLPISSDGHLAVTYNLFGLKPNLTYEVFLHGATLLAMYLYFWRDIVHIASSLLPKNRERTADRRLVALIVAGTLVTGVVAKLLEPVVEPMSGDMLWVSIWFLATAAVLWTAELLSGRVAKRAEMSDLTFPQAGFIGLLQGAAVLPGLSRSGSTIASAMLSGLDRERAARFAFLLGIPIITLAFALDAGDVLTGAAGLPSLAISLAGFAAAGVSGYLAIWGLLRFVREHRLIGFAVYTTVLGVILLATTLLGRG